MSNKLAWHINADGLHNRETDSTYPLNQVELALSDAQDKMAIWHNGELLDIIRSSRKTFDAAIEMGATPSVNDWPQDLDDHKYGRPVEAKPKSVTPQEDFGADNANFLMSLAWVHLAVMLLASFFIFDGFASIESPGQYGSTVKQANPIGLLISLAVFFEAILGTAILMAIAHMGKNLIAIRQMMAAKS
ncbi:hypothetical protein G3R49_12525 [Shewanella sp. WXL01]|uniref:hypothetical protein n=1 Tax=Shewanella sp. WXL01 TaxID=2709721 RepID=UPI00143856AA|nr:hypothetical protein [Shewanella sp. WXL01]NKF51383.1 hypothetical protein [Shewanella sp. WXL01]